MLVGTAITIIYDNNSQLDTTKEGGIERGATLLQQPGKRYVNFYCFPASQSSAHSASDHQQRHLHSKFVNAYD